MEFFKIDINNKSKIICEFELSADNSILIAKFKGDYGVGSNGNIDGNFIFSNLVSIYFIYEPIILILDLCELKYSWGNTILKALNFYHEIGRDDEEKRKFIAIIVNENNQNAINNLLGSLKERHQQLFTSRMDAIKIAEKKVKEFIE